MLKAKDGDFFISDWLRNRNTVEFLGIWEQVHNPAFNHGGFAAIKSQAGLNNYKLSVKEWVAQTNAIGLVAKAGRYGGTYAHKDIAFEFGMWISAEFKIYLINLIKEFQRLKETEYQQLGWDIRRNLAKINYRIHTDAIKANLIPPQLTPQQINLINLIYASEADLLNMALFGKTAKAKPRNSGTMKTLAARVTSATKPIPRNWSAWQSGNAERTFHPSGAGSVRTAETAEPDRHPANEAAVGGCGRTATGREAAMNGMAQALTGQASFTLRGRNPDVLTCIANLSNDEVFTPPEFANRMLDSELVDPVPLWRQASLLSLLPTGL